MSGISTPAKHFLSPWHNPFKTLFILFLLIVFLVWFFFINKDDQAADYLTADVVKADIENLVTATGILQPRNYVDVGAQVSGQLKKLYVVVGSEVKAGDLLAEIDATVYSAKVDGIRAQLRNQKAQLLDKQAQLTLAKIRFERQQNLQQDDATTKEAVQIAEAGFHSAQAQLQSVQAQIQQTDSSLRSEEATLSYARIYAPISGTVVTITSRQGQTLNTNQQAPTIMRIADLTSMTVQTQVSEADIGKLTVNMPVYFTTLGGKDHRWYSTLNRLEPTPSVVNNVVLYNALFDVPNENRVLMTQMSTQVFFIAASAKNALVIPASAVNFVLRKPQNSRDEKSKHTATQSSSKTAREKNSVSSVDEKTDDKNRSQGQPSAKEIKPQFATVQVIQKNGKIVEQQVKLGISNRVQVQVLEGLLEGETVITGVRQIEKPNTPASAMGTNPSTPGASASRMMR